MERFATIEYSPVNGRPLYLGYSSTEVRIASTNEVAYFHYVTEPPHGDALLQLLFRGKIFPGYVWGCSSYWSPSGRYLAVDWAGPFHEKINRLTVLIDLQEWQYIETDGFQVLSVDDAGIHGKALGGNAASIFFHRQVQWVAAT